MVTLYVSPLVEESLERMLSVSEERRSRIESCKAPETRKQMLTAGLLLNRVLDKHGIDAAKVTKGPYGKPMVEGVQFNLSHTEGLVICAVSQEKVGCDVEKIKQVPEGVAERFFHNNEKKYDKAFFRIWTLKESYMKMTGEGVHLSMCDFEVHLGEKVSIWRRGELQECFMKEYDIPGYQIAVCAEEEEFSEIIWETV